MYRTQYCTVLYHIPVQVFESVISWINHSTEQRSQNLPMLIEHVRLPLLSQDYLIHKVRCPTQLYQVWLLL